MEARTALDLTSVDRYWREANGGDSCLKLHHRLRTLSNSNDNVFKQNRLLTPHQMARRGVDDAVPGDVVECGSWRGRCTGLVADTPRAASWPGRFPVFDSFAERRFALVLVDVDTYRTRHPPKLFLESHLIGAVMLV